MPQAPGIARQCFSTDDFPAAEREAVWREVISRNIMRVDLSRPRDHPLYNRMECLELPGVTIVLGSGSPCTSARSTELLSDASDQVFFSFNKSGRSRARWLGKEEELAVGDAIIVPTAEAGQMEFPAAFQYVGLRMDRSMLATMVDGLDDALMTLAPRQSPALHMLLGYIRLVERSGDQADQATQNLFSLHLQYLLALTIGANGDARHIAAGRGLAAARLAMLKADIIERLPLGPVRIGELAARHAISEVYIRKLFSSDGTTLTDFVAEKRLAAAHRALLNPLLESQSISQLAYAAGFSDLSHFNRRFRQRYGRTPSEVRGALRNYRT